MRIAKTEQNRWTTAESPLIIGHRGASAEAPENTLAAFRLAIAQGADGLEFDVQPTADGRPMIIHDETLDRTTNGRGAVLDHTAEQLAHLDAGQGEPIPTLEAVFAAFGREIVYNVELKDYSLRDRGTEAAVAALIRKYGVADRVLVSSFSPIAMQRAAAVLPAETMTAVVRYTGLQKYSYHLYRGEADHPYHRMITPRYMAWAKRKGYLVNTWTVDDVEEAHRLIDLGVKGIITNRPGKLVTALRS